MASNQVPRLGDIVLLKQGIGVIRYHGNVDFDEDTKYYGVELKGPSISGGHNGSYNGKKYFETTGGDGRGIFVRDILRIISSEEILEKLAEIYDILKGRNKHSHFIDRATYEDLSDDHNHLKQELEDKLNEIKDLNMDLSLLKEQINMMKGTLGDKIEETATLSGKIHRAEKKFGARLSQVDLSAVQQRLKEEENGNKNGMNIPDYGNSQTQTQKKGHRKQRSSTTIALDSLNDDFSDIAKNVSAYGQKNNVVSGPTHYRKFSNTTKMIMDQHKNENGNGWTQMNKSKGHKARESMKIGDIVDENGIDFDDDEHQILERQSNDEKDEEPQRQNKSRASRQSRQLDDDEIKNEFLAEIEQEVQERESNEEEEEVKEVKRPKKNRASRESRQLLPSEYEQQQQQQENNDDDDDLDNGKQRIQKSRSSRESRQINPETDMDLGFDENEYEVINDDALGNNMQIDANDNQKPVKRNKARGSVQIESSVLSSSALETHNEHHMEKEAAEINGPKDTYIGNKHKKSDTMTSDSSAYRAFMSVD